MKTQIRIHVISLSMALCFSTPSLGGESKPSRAHQACQAGEGWVFSEAISKEMARDFEAFLSKKIQTVRGFSDGISLRRLPRSEEARLFSEYWISRSLLQGKLFHIAHNGLSSIAARPIVLETLGIQLAALDCLVQIQAHYPDFTIPAHVITRMRDYLPYVRETADVRIVWESAGIAVRAKISEGNPQTKEIEYLISLMEGSGAHEALARGFWSAYQGELQATVHNLEIFFNLGQTGLPQSLKKFSDPAHISLARAYYTLGQFTPAAAHLRGVSKSSNELANSLSELSWAFLLDEKYSESIGTAMNLQAGGLRHTFAPEAPMVMAMGLNELCQYPESVRAIQTFRKYYEPSYKWLSSWKNGEKDLYPLAVDFVKKKGNTPDRVASEWVRSPLFLSSQNQINLLFDEKESAIMLGRSGSKEQRKLATEILDIARDLKPKLRQARAKQKPGEKLPGRIMDQLTRLREQIVRFRRLQLAAPVWRTILANYQNQVPGKASQLIARINQDLKSRSLRMLKQLDEIAENLQLIEVEIYNGASQDIIWQNAHPDYKKMAKQLSEERDTVVKEKVWDWGRAPTAVSDEENAEIWEDELGSFKANLYDNCSSKDKYLALKMNRGSS